MFKDLKMVMLMRNDLNMRKGKMIAQGGHAVANIISSCNFGPAKTYRMCESWMEDFEQKKICLGINSKSELVDIITEFTHAADDDTLLSSASCLIYDNGHTEFHGEETLTCGAILGEAETIDKFTRHLKLL